MSRVLAMLSGGVDSSVTAFLLQQAGHEVIGLTLSLFFGEDSNTCCGVAANCKAKDVCDKLGIKHYALNKRRDFDKYVVKPYVESHRQARTPMSCVDCNTHVKIGGMLQYADFFKCDYIATGHYVISDGVKLAMGSDPSKDQSYMLSRIHSKIMPRLLLPLGPMFKADVRGIAEANNIYAPSDSQDLCFVEKENRAEFLQERGIKFEDGDIINSSSGDTIGRHTGIYNYTIGQRKGLPGSSNGPLYVLRINRDKNQVIVGSEENLLVKSCVVKDFNWLYEPSTNRVTAKIRYRSAPAQATWERHSDDLLVTFDEPQKAVTPGQCLVMYDRNILIGGGWIT